MKYYFIAGEASGDLHASNLMKALKINDIKAEFRFFGGDLMASVGNGTLVKHYREMAFMGVIPVLLNFRKIMRNMQICRTDIQAYNPDAVILVDYPGFNLKIAEFVKKRLQCPVFYYISPKIWAWKKYRIKTIRRYVDKMLCILPFEVDFYKSLDYQVNYVGNPTVDEIRTFLSEHPENRNAFLSDNNLNNKPIIAVLAGSRKQEIKKNLPTMLASVKQNFEYQIIIAGAPGLTMADYSPYITSKDDVKIVFNKTYELLQYADISLVTSGTATLETALFNVPQVVCYHVSGGKLVNFIFNRFFQVQYISLVNLIAGKEVVKELFGAGFSIKSIQNEVNSLLNNSEYREKMLEGYREVATKLGTQNAPERAAEMINLSSKKEIST
ncbi:MAG: lipid-A-disaccharide synthase [Tannerella sp.]|jgi:lipid-A-disaccharide synthase|nr:lipid-A-disaccharide synthase [Tannerella sp.]